MTRGRILLLVLLACLVLLGAAYATTARRRVAHDVAGRFTHATDSSGMAPAGVRVRVEVINTTRTRGLAMRATRLLRDHGFDVVEVATGGPMRDTSLVLDRSGHPHWAATVARVLGPAARSESRPDSSHYLDVTVLLGSAWHPPAQPLDP
jgi:hypothetical protein